MKPEISVVISLYNKERYIRRTIDSVLHQTFQNFELIIIDSSTDSGTELVDQVKDPRINHILLKKGTAAYARNFGACQAHSDLIAFLDADDEWQPDHLETLQRLRKKYPDAGLYSTPYVKIKPDGKPAVMLFVGIPKPPWEGYLVDYLQICSRGDEPVHSSSCAVPKDIFNAIGGFPENLVYGEDQYLWGKISLKYPVVYSWNGLTIYHTEAQGRICDEIHVIQEHPFSAYLRQELEAGAIPAEKISECRAYIRRKRYAEIISRLVQGSEPNPCEYTSEPDINPAIGSDGLVKTSHSSLRIISQSFNRFYHSSVHDAVRWCLCKIYRCYDPGELLKKKD